MRVAVVASHPLFTPGTPARASDGLVAALRAAGHVVEAARLPYRAKPIGDLPKQFDIAERYAFHSADRVIAIGAPAVALRHRCVAIWLLEERGLPLGATSPVSPMAIAVQDAVAASVASGLERAEVVAAGSAGLADRVAGAFGRLPVVLPPPSGSDWAPTLGVLLG